MLSIRKEKIKQVLKTSFLFFFVLFLVFFSRWTVRMLAALVDESFIRRLQFLNKNKTIK